MATTPSGNTGRAPTRPRLATAAPEGQRMPPLDDNGAPAIGAPQPAARPAAETAAGPGRPRPGRPPALAGGSEAARRLRPLLDTDLDALSEGAAHRAGPLPAGGPDTVARQVLAAATPVFPDTGTGADEALHTLVRALAAGAADPADPYCTAHLHGPPLAMAVAADLAASALNPSLDSWDHAPAASTLETLVTAELARLVYPGHPAPDAVVTTGGTESNHLALLLARERARATGSPGPRVLCGANAHHSVHRAAWLLGLPEPQVLPTPNGILDPAAADHNRVGDDEEGLRRRGAQEPRHRRGGRGRVYVADRSQAQRDDGGTERRARRGPHGQQDSKIQGLDGRGRNRLFADPFPNSEARAVDDGDGIDGDTGCQSTGT